MAVQKISITDFIEQRNTEKVFDVRSPGEYNHAHIPFANTLPLFNDEERKHVGTTYKQKSREQAIKDGLDFFGPKMKLMVEQVEKLTGHTSNAPQNIYVHCWRGGMRSAAVAWLLDLYGFQVKLIVGGYKAYRNWVLQQFEKDYAFRIIGGYTGSGKSIMLRELEKKSKSIIDLEGLANHKGSAFGGIAMPQQPSQEMFENLLAMQLHQKQTNTIWLEDESQRIGTLNIPHALWHTIRKKPLYFVEVPFEERLHNIVLEYGPLEKDKLISSIIRIQKRLGPLETKNAIAYLVENDLKECFRILLQYYDKTYEKGLHNRESLETLLNRIPFINDHKTCTETLCAI